MITLRQICPRVRELCYLNFAVLNDLTLAQTEEAERKTTRFGRGLQTRRRIGPRLELQFLQVS